MAVHPVRTSAYLPPFSVAALALAIGLALMMSLVVGVAAFSLQPSGVSQAQLAAERDAAYRSGLTEGRAQGIRDGQQQGARDGRKSGFARGRKVGYAQGLRRGRIAGFQRGHTAGYNEGYAAGLAAAPSPAKKAGTGKNAN
jgi:hypothetical protein